MLRQANKSDVAVIAELLYKMAAELESIGEYKMVSKPIAKKSLKETIAEEIKNPQYYFVLAQSNETDSVIGLGIADIINLGSLWEVDKILHINDVYVEPNNRHQGIGKKITKSLMQWGAKRGCKHYELNVLMNNNAVAFYRALGFKTIRYQMARSI